MACEHQYERLDTELGRVWRCKKCGKDLTRFFRRIQNLFIKQRLYQGKGVSYTSWVNGIYNTIQTGGILVLIFGGDNTRMIAVWVFVLAWILQTSVETWIGYKDYTRWKMAQREATLTRSYDPVATENNRILNELRDKIIPEKKRPSILDTFRKQN